MIVTCSFSKEEIMEDFEVPLQKTPSASFKSKRVNKIENVSHLIPRQSYVIGYLRNVAIITFPKLKITKMIHASRSYNFESVNQ